MHFSFENSSFRDKDTGVYNLAYFMEILFREWHRLIREQDRLSIILIHPEYQALSVDERKSLADSISSCVFRSTDIISRLNERDFLVGLFNLNKDATNVVLNRLQTELDKKNQQHHLDITASALNIKPDKGIQIEDIFEQLQMQLRDVETSGLSNIKLEEYQLH